MIATTLTVSNKQMVKIIKLYMIATKGAITTIITKAVNKTMMVILTLPLFK